MPNIELANAFNAHTRAPWQPSHQHLNAFRRRILRACMRVLILSAYGVCTHLQIVVADELVECTKVQELARILCISSVGGTHRERERGGYCCECLCWHAHMFESLLLAAVVVWCRRSCRLMQPGCVRASLTTLHERLTCSHMLITTYNLRDALK